METLTPLPKKRKPGPKKNHRRLSTRLACILAGIAKNNPGKMIPTPLDRLAVTLDCSRETLRKLTMRLRLKAWFFQAYGAVIHITHEKSPECPKGRWMLWVVHRHSIHRIKAEPGAWRRLRWHLRKGDHSSWKAYLVKIRQWAMAIIFKKRRDGKHKAFCQGIGTRAGGARAPNTDNRPALRRFGGRALALGELLSALPGAPVIKITGWVLNRLSEQHSELAIRQAFIHACNLLRKRRIIHIDNVAAWVCGVAGYHLEADGLVPSQRRFNRLREKAGRHGAVAPTYNEKEKVSLPEAAKSETISGHGPQTKEAYETYEQWRERTDREARAQREAYRTWWQNGITGTSPEQLA